MVVLIETPSETGATSCPKIIFTHAKKPLPRLTITPETLLKILLHHQISPKYLRLILPSLDQKCIEDGESESDNPQDEANYRFARARLRLLHTLFSENPERLVHSWRQVLENNLSTSLVSVLWTTQKKLPAPTQNYGFSVVKDVKILDPKGYFVELRTYMDTLFSSKQGLDDSMIALRNNFSSSLHIHSLICEWAIGNWKQYMGSLEQLSTSTHRDTDNDPAWPVEYKENSRSTDFFQYSGTGPTIGLFYANLQREQARLDEAEARLSAMEARSIEETKKVEAYFASYFSENMDRPPQLWKPHSRNSHLAGSFKDGPFIGSKTRYSPSSHRKMLPVRIQGKMYNSVPDTGSIDNAMSEEFARSIGAVLEKREVPEHFQNACGKEFVSEWTTTLPCSFRDRPDSINSCTFSVVSKLSVPLIMGSEFLRVTQTLTKFKHRLIKIAGKAVAKWRLLQTQIPRRRLRCSLNGEEMFVNADTGSNIDLVSLKFAQQQNLRIKWIDKRLRKVQLADGTVSRLAGKVSCRFKVGTNDADEEETRDFYVLPGLTSEVLVGDHTLEEHEAFDAYEAEFIDVDDIPNSVDLIYWVGSEGWPSLHAMIKDATTGELDHVSALPQSTVKKWAVRIGLKGGSKIWRAADVLGHDTNYQRYVDKVANWNERDKDLFERKIATLSGRERLDAENEERVRLQRYETARSQLEALHQARKAGAAGGV